MQLRPGPRPFLRIVLFCLVVLLRCVDAGTTEDRDSKIFCVAELRQPTLSIPFTGTTPGDQTQPPLGSQNRQSPAKLVRLVTNITSGYDHMIEVRDTVLSYKHHKIQIDVMPQQLVNVYHSHGCFFILYNYHNTWFKDQKG